MKNTKNTVQTEEIIVYPVVIAMYQHRAECMAMQPLAGGENDHRARHAVARLADLSAGANGFL